MDTLGWSCDKYSNVSMLCGLKHNDSGKAIPDLQKHNWAKKQIQSCIDINSYGIYPYVYIS